MYDVYVDTLTNKLWIDLNICIEKIVDDVLNYLNDTISFDKMYEKIVNTHYFAPFTVHPEVEDILSFSDEYLLPFKKVGTCETVSCVTSIKRKNLYSYLYLMTNMKTGTHFYYKEREYIFISYKDYESLLDSSIIFSDGLRNAFFTMFCIDVSAKKTAILYVEYDVLDYYDGFYETEKRYLAECVKYQLLEEKDICTSKDYLYALVLEEKDTFETKLLNKFAKVYFKDIVIEFRYIFDKVSFGVLKRVNDYYITSSFYKVSREFFDRMLLIRGQNDRDIL